jgi:hypothetical protein
MPKQTKTKSSPSSDTLPVKNRSPKAKQSTVDTVQQSKTVRRYNKPFFEEYYSVISGKKEILNSGKLDALRDYILKCSQNCDGTSHVSHYLKSPDAPFKVEVRTYEKWLHKYPQLNEAHNELMEAIGDNLRQKVLKYEVPPVLIHKDLNLYCDRYKKLFEWEHALKNKDKDSSSNMTVIFEQIKDCPNVPPCERNESND